MEGTGEKPSSCTNTTSDISATDDPDLDEFATSSGADAGSDHPEVDDDDDASPGLRVGLLSVGLGALAALFL